MGSLCQAARVSQPFRLLASPAGSCQRPPSVSPRGLPSPLAQSSSPPPLRFGTAPTSFQLTCLCSLLVALAVTLPSLSQVPGGPLHSCLPPWPTLIQETTALPLPIHSVSLPFGTGPLTPHVEKNCVHSLEFLSLLLMASARIGCLVETCFLSLPELDHESLHGIHCCDSLLYPPRVTPWSLQGRR